MELYSLVHGNVTINRFIEISDKMYIWRKKKIDENLTKSVYFNEFGQYETEDGECILFPSENEISWNNYVEKPDLPKGTPCICFGTIINNEVVCPDLRYYAGNGSVYMDGRLNGCTKHYLHIIPKDKYKFEERTFNKEDNYGIALP